MYEVEITSGFAAAHRLRNYNGKCERLHGHNYKVAVAMRAEAPAEDGMVIDFTELKKATVSVLERLDHAYLNDIPPFDNLEPSAEHIAAHIFREIKKRLGIKGELLYSIAVWESDNSVARFLRD